MKISGFAPIAVAVLSTSAIAQDATNFDFKGVPLGISIDEFRAWQHPDNRENTRVACTGEKVQKSYGAFEPSGVAVYDASELAAGVVKCIWIATRSDGAMYYVGDRVALSLAGSGYAAYDYSFSFVPDPIDGKLRLYKFLGTSNINAAPAVIEALTSKYGKPEISSGEVQNKIGNSFAQTRALWSNTNGSILVEDRYLKIDDMVIIVSDKRLSKVIEETDAARKASIPNGI